MDGQGGGVMDAELQAIMARNAGAGGQPVEGGNPQEQMLRQTAMQMGIPGAEALPLPELQQAIFRKQSEMMGGEAAFQPGAGGALPGGPSGGGALGAAAAQQDQLKKLMGQG